MRTEGTSRCGSPALPYLFDRTEGRPGLKSVLWSKTSFRIHCPVPAVTAVVIKVSVTIMGIIRVLGDPAFFNWLQAIGGTGCNKRTTLIFLRFKTKSKQKHNLLTKWSAFMTSIHRAHFEGGVERGGGWSTCLFQISASPPRKHPTLHPNVHHPYSLN